MRLSTVRMRLWLGCLLATGLTLLAAAGAGAMEGARAKAAIVTSGEPKAGGLAAYGTLPLSFAPNAGQLERRVLYSAQAAGSSFLFTRKEALLSFAQNKKPSVALRLRFVSANPDVVVDVRKRQAGTVNYLRGNDPAKWRTNVPTFGEVVYRDLWPGIDLVFRGANGQLKYELHVAAGASVEHVRLAYSGASGLSLDRSGNLRIKTSLGTITDSHPVSYQQVDGKRVPVASRFLLPAGADTYGFALASYDHSRPLVVDPGLEYSVYLNWGEGWGIAVDGARSAYVTGIAPDAFPVTAGAVDKSGHGGDAFVTKLNPAGTALVYSTFLGGFSSDVGFGIAVDRAGSAYVTGFTRGDFPTTAGAFDRSFSGADAFVTKLNATGSALVYSTSLGKIDSSYGTKIAVDGAGNAYVTGSAPMGFPTTARALDRSYNGGRRDVFVTKLNAAGSALVYSTYLGGNHDDHAWGIAVDRRGGAYVTGVTKSEVFPTTRGAFDRSRNPTAGGFVTKLNASGAALVYSTYLGGRAVDVSGSGDYHGGLAITVNGTGNAYVASATASRAFPTTPGAFDRSVRGVAVTKLNAAGSALVYSTYLGPGGYPTGIAVDATGSAYITGLTSSEKFPTTPGAFDRSYNDPDSSPATDAFVTKLNATGSTLLYSTYLGGSRFDRGEAIAVDGAGNAYVTGSTFSRLDFPSTTGRGVADGAFVTKLDIPERCVVPAVVGMPLARASAKIRLAGCSVGDVRRERSENVGLVIEQRPRAGTTGDKGMKVNLVVGRR